MKRFLTSTATALVLGTAAYADGHSAVFSDMAFDAETNLNASDLIGMRVYATEADISNEIAVGGETEWDDIGDINEIVLTREGDVQSVIIGVGGFLGMGEKDVALDMSQIKFVTEEGDDDFFLVVNANAAGVEQAPAYERGMMGDEVDADEASDESMVTDNNATDIVRPTLMAPAVEREGYMTADIDDLTTEDLTGARVYGPADEDVGEISELLMSTDGKLERAVIDVGGFLGMGERSVAVTMDELQIMRTDDGDDLRVYIDSSQDVLEQLPVYED